METFEDLIVDIPEEAIHVTTTDRVYLSDRSTGKERRLTIGTAINAKQMHPNENYASKYTAEFEEASKTQVPQIVLSIGMYVVSLAICIRNGLYTVLIRAFGIKIANLVMDFACYSIIQKSNVAKDFKTTMEQQMLYSAKAFSDSTLSERFKNDIPENKIENFRFRWTQMCMKHGAIKVWLCLDGSNNDCDAQTIEIVEEGKPKSHTSSKIVGYMYALDADGGLPITYREYRGSRVDSKEIYEMIDFLKGYGLEIEGVILDRAFCTINNIRFLNRLELKYIIMMKGECQGFRTMYEKYGSKIKSQLDYYLGKNIYGAQDKCRIFKAHEEEAWITLCYDEVNGPERSAYLTKQVYNAVKDAREAIENGEAVKIPSKCREYITESEKDGKPCYEVDTKALQEAKDKKGFYALICSDNDGAQKSNDTYDLRDQSEKQYSTIKSQLGGKVTRVHTIEGMRAKFLIQFVACIIRHEMLKAASKLGMDLNSTIKELSELKMHRQGISYYIYSHTENEKQLKFLAEFGITPEVLDYVAKTQNARMSGRDTSMLNTLPIDVPDDDEEEKADSKGTGAADSSESGAKAGDASKSEQTSEAPKRHPGRPKGSKNKPKAAKTAPAENGAKTEAASKPETEQTSEVPKRHRGRPKGSKNKPKAAKSVPAESTSTAAAPAENGAKTKAVSKPEAEQAAETPKRHPGRPKGSKNKPKAAKTAPAESTSTAAAPAQNGAKTEDASKAETEQTAETPKRHPGRPKGSRNKPKTVSVASASASDTASTLSEKPAMIHTSETTDDSQKKETGITALSEKRPGTETVTAEAGHAEDSKEDISSTTETVKTGIEGTTMPKDGTPGNALNDSVAAVPEISGSSEKERENRETGGFREQAESYTDAGGADFKESVGTIGENLEGTSGCIT